MQNAIIAAQAVGQRFTARKWLMVALWCACTVLLTGIQLLNENGSADTLQKLPEALRVGGAGTSAIMLGNLVIQWFREMTDKRHSLNASQAQRKLNTDVHPTEELKKVVPTPYR